MKSTLLVLATLAAAPAFGKETANRKPASDMSAAEEKCNSKLVKKLEHDGDYFHLVAPFPHLNSNARVTWTYTFDGNYQSFSCKLNENGTSCDCE